MKATSWILLIVVAAGLVLAGLVWVVAVGTPVEVIEVQPGAVEEFVDERGVTRLPETHLITMPFPGRIEAISLVEGTPVKRGQVVARVVQRDVELEVQQARAAVERLEAAIRKNADTTVENTLLLQARRFVQSMQSAVEAAAQRVKAGLAKADYAEKHLGRVQQLYQSSAVSEEDRDRALLEKVQAAVDYRQDELVHAAMVALQAATDLLPTMVQQYIDRKELDEAILVKQKAEAEAMLHQIQQNQQRSVMTSPVDGVVLKRYVTSEQFLPAGTPLLEIGRLEDLEVEADVLSLDVVRMHIGDPVKIYGPTIGPRPARGTVVRIEPAGFTKISSLGVEQQRVKIIIRFDPQDLARLRRERNLGVGYRVRVRIVTSRKTNVLCVPRSALFRGPGGQWQLFVVSGGRAQIRDVQIGLMNDQLAEVLAGVQAGELVIPAPESTLADGQRVKVLR